MANVLVIDDDPAVSVLVGEALPEEECTLATAATAADGLRRLNRDRPDVIVLDVLLPDQTGLEVFQQIQQLDAKLPVVFITSRAASSLAIEAMRLGAYDFLLKPLDLAQLRRVVTRAVQIRKLTQSPISVSESVAKSPTGPDLLVGRSPAMQQVYKEIGRVASQHVPVLISGESGSGKELVARAIALHGQRENGPFMVVHCKNGSEEAINRELFGEDARLSREACKPDARPSRQGPRMLEADGGILFLDEVGELPLSTQAKLLRFLQDQSFERLGVPPTGPDVRIIAATNLRLEERVAAGLFRPDLYYHLGGFMIRVPPLRERLEDLSDLAWHIVKRLNHEFRKRIYQIAPEVIETLARHDWPGNVRELQSVLRQAVVRATGTVLVPDFLPAPLIERPGGSAQLTGRGAAHTTDWAQHVDRLIHDGAQNLYSESVQLMERHVLSLVLQHTHGNQAQAARYLGITRGSLRTRLRSLGLVIDKQIDVRDDVDEPIGGAAEGAPAES